MYVNTILISGSLSVPVTIQDITACNYTGYFDVSQYELCSVSMVHCSLILNITGCVGCMQLLCSFIVFTCRYMAIHVHSNNVQCIYVCVRVFVGSCSARELIDTSVICKLYTLLKYTTPNKYTCTKYTSGEIVCRAHVALPVLIKILQLSAEQSMPTVLIHMHTVFLT